MEETTNNSELQVESTSIVAEVTIGEVTKDEVTIGEVKKEEVKKDNVLRLRTSQTKHFIRVVNILKESFAYIDTSQMGTGKTFIVMAVAAHYKLPILVIAIKSAMDMWKRETEKYNIPLLGVITFQTLRGNDRSGCNHPYLTRENGEYHPTSELMELIKSKILIVFDETHKLKNPGTAQSRAGHCLVKEVVRQNSGSRVALLSATPIDKPEHIEPFCKLAGIVTRDKMYEFPSRNNPVLLGMKQVVNKCMEINPDETNRIANNVSSADKSQMQSILYNLYIKVLRDQITSSMPKLIIDAEQDLANGFYKMLPDDILAVNTGLNAISRSITDVDKKSSFWATITKSMKIVEFGKLRTLIRLAKESLNNNEDCQVILFVWYSYSIEYLAEHLAEYCPMIMVGKTSSDNRTDVIKRFQSDNNTNRLIIANTAVGGTGISLDDQFGNRPRFVFGIPNYNITDLHQATGRIYRQNTKSKAVVRFIYSYVYRDETKLLDSLAKKSLTMKEAAGNSDDIKYPGEYVEFKEDGDVDFSSVIDIDGPTLDIEEIESYNNDASNNINIDEIINNLKV